MEILKTQFEGRASQRGWNFKQIKRNGNIALYEKRDTETKSVFYEVIVIRDQKETKITKGTVQITFHAKEVYPNDEAFGTDGWCYTLLDRAQNKYSKLIQEREEKSLQQVEIQGLK